MPSHLPRWIEYGAFILALCAGCINAIGLAGLSHQAISYLSGIATSVGATLSRGDVSAALHLALILLAFLLGAALSGLLLSGRSVKQGRHYDWLLLIEGVLLIIAMLLMHQGSFIGHYLASCACGIQNALATTYSGAVVRTTHVTGVFTDLGLMLGARLRGEGFEQRKANLLLLIIAGFIGGGLIGTYLFSYVGFFALSLPVVICFVLALSYRFYVKKPTLF